MFRRELLIGFMSKDIRRWSRHIKDSLACRKSGGDIGESKLHETVPEWRDVIDPVRLAFLTGAGTRLWSICQVLLADH